MAVVKGRYGTEPPAGWIAPEVMTVGECAWYLRRSYDWVIDRCLDGSLVSSKAPGRTGRRSVRKQHANDLLRRLQTAPDPDPTPAPVARPERGRRARPQPKTSAAAS